MITACIGYYCLVVAILQVVFLWASTLGNDKNKAEFKIRRTLIWVSNPLFFGVAVLALRGS